MCTERARGARPVGSCTVRRTALLTSTVEAVKVTPSGLEPYVRPCAWIRHLLCLDPRKPLRAGSGVRAALEGVTVMEAGARELALPAVTVLLRVDHLE